MSVCEDKAHPIDISELFQADRLVDPYPFVQALHAAAPIHWDTSLNAWMVTRYAECAAILRDAQGEFIQTPMPEQASEAEPYRRLVSHALVFLDPPDHTRLRKLMSRAFTPHRIEKLRPMVQKLADEMLDAVATRGRMDIIRELTSPLALAVMAHILGFPQRQRAQLTQWSQAIDKMAFSQVAFTAEEYAPILAAGREIVDYCHHLIAEPHAPPSDTVIGDLVTAFKQGHLNEEELIGQVMVLIIGSSEAMNSSIGIGLLALLHQPEQWHTLLANPTLIPAAVEEMLRYQSPLAMTSRRATMDLEICGHAIKAGEDVWVMLQAANCDPTLFNHPDQLDIERPNNRHLSFGGGIHFCLGAALARLEMEVMVGTLVQRMPKLRLASEPPEWTLQDGGRALLALPVVF